MRNVFRRLMRPRRIPSLIARLSAERGGNFATMFAIAAVPIIGAVGLAVDYTEITRTRSHIAEALDAAAFVAADGYSRKKGESAITEDARRVFYANLQENGVKENVEFRYDGFFSGQDANFIRVRAMTALTPTFMPVVWAMLDDNASSDDDGEGDGGDDGGEGTRSGVIDLGLKSEVAVATTTVELALVLDNSGSMAGSKISTLREAASDLVTELFGAVAPNSAVDAVKFSLVPFAGAVNVGPQNATANWMDRDGRSPIHHENFNWSTLPGASKINGIWKKNDVTLSRFWLFDQVQVAWGGCVEARPYPLNIDDTIPAYNAPETLFVPMFAPDAPDRYRVNWTYENYYSNSYIADFLGEEAKANDIDNFFGAAQHARQGWMKKYDQTGRVDNVPISRGPNYACTSIPILPLSHNEQDVLDRIDDMLAHGSTNIAEGAAWGMRTLSPAQPFTGGREYGAERNIKAMVIMTDGENTYYTDYGNRNESTYGPYGFSANDRIFAGTDYYHTSQYSKAMDSHLAKVCQAAKAKEIVVFTIAFDVDSDSPVKPLLENCASRDRNGEPNYFDANSNEELKTAFGTIGSKVSGIRLYR